MRKVLALIFTTVLLSGCTAGQPEKTSQPDTVKKPEKVEILPDPEQNLSFGDMIIEKVELKAQPECRNEYEAGLVCIGDRYTFDIYIKNIGTAVAPFPFYIDNTSTDKDFLDNDYSQTILATSNNNIAINETYKYEHSIILETPPEKIRFRLNHSKIVEGEKLRQQKELNYDNDEFEFNLKENMIIS